MLRVPLNTDVWIKRKGGNKMELMTMKEHYLEGVHNKQRCSFCDVSNWMWENEDYPEAVYHREVHRLHESLTRKGIEKLPPFVLSENKEYIVAPSTYRVYVTAKEMIESVEESAESVEESAAKLEDFLRTGKTIHRHVNHKDNLVRCNINLIPMQGVFVPVSD